MRDCDCESGIVPIGNLYDGRQLGRDEDGKLYVRNVHRSPEDDILPPPTEPLVPAGNASYPDRDAPLVPAVPTFVSNESAVARQIAERDRDRQRRLVREGAEALALRPDLKLL